MKRFLEIINQIPELMILVKALAKQKNSKNPERKTASNKEENTLNAVTLTTFCDCDKYILFEEITSRFTSLKNIFPLK